MTLSTTIVAPATPLATAALSIVRLSGPQAIVIADKCWRGLPLAEARSHTAHLGFLIEPDQSEDIDQCVVTVYRGPNTFTGEDIVEITSHGSPYITQRILNALVQGGATPAGPGEFSQRAFMNGRLDLAQAEGIADLIAANSRAAHRLALTQTKGEYSNKLKILTDKLTEFAALLELELDFSEEDVEFASRQHLLALATQMHGYVSQLAESYYNGQAIKNGIPVAIIGQPNAGKSTLLNALLHDDKAIVSDIPGTTRDIIEDTAEMDGVLYRFIDTAGLRDTKDVIEREGIQRTRRAIEQADVILVLLDSTRPLQEQYTDLKQYLNTTDTSQIIICLTKIDHHGSVCRDTDVIIGQILGEEAEISDHQPVVILLSAVNGSGMEKLVSAMKQSNRIVGDASSTLVVTNARHYDALRRGEEALTRTLNAIEQDLSPDLISIEIRAAISALSEITGAITTDTILATIFSRFCIGK